MLRCPRCSRPVSVFKLPRSRHRFLCRNCGLSYSSKAHRDEVDAFIDLTEAYESGSIPATPLPSVGESARPLPELQALVEGSGKTISELPPAVRDILKSKKDFIVLYRFIGETNPQYGARCRDLPLSPGLVEALRGRGIERLYSFQEEAITQILAGKDAVIVAPTGSGKTEAFALPIFNKTLETRGGFGPLVQATRKVQALFVYPTKALGRDQKEKLEELGAHEGITIAVFDGDTPQAERERIQAAPPDVLITDFDTIDYHLRYGDYFCQLISNVRFLVVDELHQYVGAFGANVHFIIRRMRRLLGNFQIVAASATLPNASEFAATLFGRDVRLIKCDLTRRGPVHFLMLSPIHRSFRSMMADILATLTGNGLKSLAFANTHIDAELINIVARKKGLAVDIHRAGLTAKHRRAVESAFRKGQLLALVATPTLELGIDIGDLDAITSMLTDINRLTQRLGRAGRKGQESVAVLALRDNDPISTYYKNHPDAYFVDLASAYVEPRNEIVARHQLISAALDKPIEADEFPELSHTLHSLRKEGILHEKRGKLNPTKTAYPQLLNYNIRGIGDRVTIVAGGRALGERQMPIAAYELYPGALYLHAGSRYQSKSFSFKGKMGRAEVERIPDDFNHRTKPLGTSHPEILDVESRRKAYGVQAMYCRLLIKEEVHGYLLTELHSDRIIEVKRLQSPVTYEYETRGLAFCAPRPTSSMETMLSSVAQDEDAQDALISTLTGSSGLAMFSELHDMLEGGSFHATEHVVIEGSDMLTGGGRGELSGVSMGTSGIIFIFDTAPGGSGIAKLLFDRLEEAFGRAHSILDECRCGRIDGCPMCTYSYRCGNNNVPLYKEGAKESLSRILTAESTSVDLDAYKVERPLK